MRRIVVLNNALAEVTLEGDIDETQDNTFAGRGSVTVTVHAKTMGKERFLHRFYECVFGSDESYEEAIEEFGPGFVTDDLLPDLNKASVRIYSKTLCEWKDPTFTVDHYDDVWNDTGTQCGEDSPDALRMRLASGDGTAQFTLNMAEVAETIAAQMVAGTLQWPPAIDVRISVFFDFQEAQGEGTWFKTADCYFDLCPAHLPLQVLTLDAAANTYRLIAGPSSGSVRFVQNPANGLRLLPDPQPAPANCTTTVVVWPDASLMDLLAIGIAGDMAAGHEALLIRENAFYRIDVKDATAGNAQIELTHETTADFEAFAMKQLEDGNFGPAPEATLTVVPPSERDLWGATVTGLSQDKRFAILYVDQARGAQAARHDPHDVLKAPEDSVLRRVDRLHIKLKVGTLELERTLLVGITLPRWFALEGSKEETHLRINDATLRHQLREAIKRYNETHAPPARIGLLAPDGFDKLAAGDFLFRYNATDEITRRFFLTKQEDVSGNEMRYREWLITLYGASPPDTRPPTLTEASLFVRMVELHQAKQNKLTPGDVFGLGLEETGGDIGGAFLLCHNTLRALARDCGDSLHTGISALSSTQFNKLFATIRGGYRVGDGSAGAPKDEKNAAQANFAGDNAGPWYHFFGTAFYEIHTATPEEGKPGDNRWARTANVLEQWYREYHPASWQDPDPEKEYINRCGIAAADELLGDGVGNP